MNRQINDPLIYDFPTPVSETLEDNRFLLDLSDSFDAESAASKLELEICPFGAALKANIIDVSVTVKEILGLEQYIGDGASRNVILRAIKEATLDSGEVDCNLVIQRLLARRNEVKKRIHELTA